MSNPRSKTFSPSQFADCAEVLQRISDCVFILDDNTHLVLEANAACEGILGVSSSKLIGRRLSSWIIEPSRLDFIRALQVMSRRLEARRFDVVWKKENGASLILEVWAGPLQLAGRSGKAIQVIAKDVSHLRLSGNKVQSIESAGLKTKVSTKKAKSLSALSPRKRKTGI